jgi:uncharacterized coiled-coil DUF342 family protein
MVKMPDEELSVRIVALVDDFKKSISEITDSTKKFGDDTKKSALEASNGISSGLKQSTKAVEENREAVDKNTKSAVERGREIRSMIRDDRLANIELVQLAGAASAVGQKFQQAGMQFKGATDIMKTGIQRVTDSIANLNPRLSELIGTALVFCGTSLQMFAMLTQLYLTFDKLTLSMIASSAAKAQEIIVTGYATVAQWAYNSAILACPITWLVAGILAIVAAVYLLSKAYQSAQDHAQSLRGEQERLQASMEATMIQMQLIKAGKTGGGIDALRAESDEIQRQITALYQRADAAKRLGPGYEAQEESLRKQAYALEDQRNIIMEQIKMLGEQQTAYGGPGLASFNAQQAALAKQKAEEYTLSKRAAIPWGTADYTNMEAFKAEAREYGRIWSISYTEGIAAGMASQEAKANADKAAAEAARNFESHSPPEYGPLRNVLEWGQNLSKSYAQGMERGSFEMARAGEAVAGSAARPMSQSATTNNYNPNISINVAGNGMTDSRLAQIIYDLVKREMRHETSTS